jgi:hypothetical protein
MPSIFMECELFPKVSQITQLYGQQKLYIISFIRLYDTFILFSHLYPPLKTENFTRKKKCENVTESTYLITFITYSNLNMEMAMNVFVYCLSNVLQVHCQDK